MDIVREIYQLMFISSIIFMGYTLGSLVIKIYGRFILKMDSKFIMPLSNKIILWVSLGIFLTYLIK